MPRRHRAGSVRVRRHGQRPRARRSPCAIGRRSPTSGSSASSRKAISSGHWKAVLEAPLEGARELALLHGRDVVAIELGEAERGVGRVQ
jgi:hypothetical protein